MRVMQRYLLSEVIKTFIYAVLIFTVIVLLLDLFTNINMYISNTIPFLQVVRLSLLYTPKAASYALAPSILFAVTYSISTMHSRNELVSVLNSGISFFSLIRSIVILGLLLSIFGFLFQEFAVIDTYAQKQELTQTVIGYSTSYNNTNVVLISNDTRQVYFARYYHDRTSEISGLIIISRDAAGAVTRRQDITRATYDPEARHWLLSGIVTYDIGADGTVSSSEATQMTLTDSWFMPEDFRDITFDIQQMRLKEARAYIDRMQILDRNTYLSLLTDYYERFAFSLTPLIVILISCSLGSRFKKNILLNSLLLCIIISVCYFVFEMVTILLAKQRFIPPIVGAWLPIFVFSLLSIQLLRHVRT
jgi:lipopolysaccharide export system permease protein